MPGKVLTASLWPLGEEVKDLYPCAALFGWLAFVCLYLRGHNPHSRPRWCPGNGKGCFPFLHPDQTPNLMAYCCLGWGLPQGRRGAALGKAPRHGGWPQVGVWGKNAGWEWFAQPWCLPGNQAEKTHNQQLSHLPYSVNPIAFNFFRCLCPVPVLPSYCFKWGLLFSTASGLLGSEGKQHFPDAAGAGGPGEVTCPLLPWLPCQDCPTGSTWVSSQQYVHPCYHLCSPFWGGAVREHTLCPESYLAGRVLCTWRKCWISGAHEIEVIFLVQFLMTLWAR